MSGLIGSQQVVATKGLRVVLVGVLPGVNPYEDDVLVADKILIRQRSSDEASNRRLALSPSAVESDSNRLLPWRVTNRLRERVSQRSVLEQVTAPRFGS